MKIIERREAMQSIWWKGHPTQKFTKLLSDAERFGFASYVQEQRAGIEKIKMMERAVNIAKSGHIRV